MPERGINLNDFLHHEFVLHEIFAFKPVCESSIFETGTTVSDRDYFSHVLGSLATSQITK